MKTAVPEFFGEWPFSKLRSLQLGYVAKAAGMGRVAVLPIRDVLKRRNSVLWKVMYEGTDYINSIRRCSALIKSTITFYIDKNLLVLFT